ncbi:hypothetical protein P3W45_001771 [Vairimorpha bombi]|jgi:tRNA pseudouridine synthase 10
MDKSKLDQYISNNKDSIHSNIVYCFRSEYLKNTLKPLLIQGNTQSDYFTEITINDTLIKHRNSPIFIYGEYIKLSREMTQTPLRIKGKLKCERSVSDFTEQIRDHYGSKEVKFIPSGREDIDVRMIGGRPFLLKIVEPSRNFYSSSININLYNEVNLINVRQVTKDIRNVILTGEKTEKKIYRALVASKNELNIENVYYIEQKTPLRVLHRRANLVRNKKIEILEIKKEIEDDFFFYEISLRGSAGAYIKEFVNGDMGRTRPSLSDSGNYCDLLELDVLSVEKREIDPKIIIREITLNKNNHLFDEREVY